MNSRVGHHIHTIDVQKNELFIALPALRPIGELISIKAFSVSADQVRNRVEGVQQLSHSIERAKTKSSVTLLKRKGERRGSGS